LVDGGVAGFGSLLHHFLGAVQPTRRFPRSSFVIASFWVTMQNTDRYGAIIKRARRFLQDYNRKVNKMMDHKLLLYVKSRVVSFDL
jgi:uncharacterized membrane protein YbaN (DUF454 family)